MKIVQLNVRLAEGGAARVALNLHEAALKKGHQSIFGYGYGKGGNDSAMATQIQHNIRITGRFHALVNLIAHRLTGIDILSDKKALLELEEIIKNADIIHLHAIHSHMISYSKLFELIAQKTVLWTHHDHWALTGRCAVPGLCEGDKNGCFPCQNKKAYPKTILDFAGRQYNKKHAIIGMADHITHITPSQHLADKIAQRYDKDVVVISNSIDPEFEHILHERPFPKQRDKTLLIISNDLSDSGKNNLPLITELVKNQKISIHFVGHNCPFEGDNITLHGAVSDRKEMVEIMDQCTALLFTSTVDNNPITVLEALCSGLPVIWTDSPAAYEILHNFQTKPVTTHEQVEEEILSDFPNSGWKTWSSREIAKKALSEYNSEQMIHKYFLQYDRAQK